MARIAAMIAMVTATILSKGSLACSACSCNSSSTDIHLKYHALPVCARNFDAASGDEIFHHHVRLFPRRQGRGSFQIFEETIRHLREMIFMADAKFRWDDDMRFASLFLDGDTGVRFLDCRSPLGKRRKYLGMLRNDVQFRNKMLCRALPKLDA